MDSIIRLPQTVNVYDTIWVIVDRLLSLPIFYRSRSLALWSTWHSYTLGRYSGYTESLDLLSMIGIVDSLRTFRSAYMRRWDRSRSLARPFTRRLMVRQKGPIKYLKTCYKPVHWISKEPGASTYH